MGRSHKRLGKLSSIKLRTYSSINRDEDPDINEYEYTSLKDIIVNSLPPHAPCNEPNGFDSSTISFRNELLKHAASAYVQSAAILVSRNQNIFQRVWENLKDKFLRCSCWRVYVRKPLRTCFRPIFQFLNYVVDQITRTWHEKIRIA
ncbi:hypothetical protein Acr_00g0083790 [Actinidia rufa]|uniref:Uncharacterized protein n=1 Tax=Actinidia rufa TaxID=165716 RepID=A0A7J0DUZ9_9ERIC|nr:hypothetical protein Acr_00g0083790 [Actinidia rufa]